MNATPIALLTLVGSLLAADLSAQRPRFGRRNRPQPAPQQPAPEPEAEPEDDKVETWKAIVGADLHVGTGQVIRRATILIGDDKIHEVGAGDGVDLPEGTEIIDAKGKVVCPGFVILTSSGMGAGSDKDSHNPFDPTMKQGLAAGITTFLSGRPSGRDKPGGTTTVVKLAYGDLEGMHVADKTVLGMRVPLTPQQMDTFRESVDKAREYRDEKTKWADKVGAQGKIDDKDKAPKAPQGADDLLSIMDGKCRLWIEGARDNAAIEQACEIAEILGTGVVIRDPVTAWSCPDVIAASGSMVSLNPRNVAEPDPSRPDTTGSNLAAAAILAEAGVPIAVQPPQGRFGGGGVGTGGILGQDLNTPHVDAAYAVRGGLDNRQALRTLTLDAARMIGVDDRVGSIEKGKDADLLILDGDPLHYKTFVQVAIVNGKVVYEKAEEPYFGHIRR